MSRPDDLRERYASTRTWWTMEVNQRAGAAIARRGLAAGYTPSQLSVANAVIGILTSAAVVLLGGAGWAAAVTGFVGWQLAYSFDCADGQLARASGKTSPMGGAIDSVADFTAQTFMMLAVLWGADQALDEGLAPVTSAALFAAWIVAPYYAGVMHDLAPQVAMKGFSPRNLFRQSRDYGLNLFVIALLMAVRPEWMVVAVAVVGAMNLLALVRAFWHLPSAGR